MHLILALLLSFFFVTGIEAQTPKSIAIFTYYVKDSPTWDPDSIATGVNGSEEAVIYMSQHVVNLGYKVTVLGNPPAGSKHSLPQANPRFVKTDFDDGSHYDVGVSWRMPWNAEELKMRANKVYLWPHDTYHSPLSITQILGFDGVLWVSEYQHQQWMSVNPPFVVFKPIFGNGINPDQFQPVQNRENPYSCIYGSNYARGLDVLLDIWPEVKKQYPKATLDIYYGWQHWGLLPPEHEKKMREQVKNLESSGVKEHGSVGHDELNRAYAKASFWTYPCTSIEVFCITALRAQLSGAVPVIIDGGALPYTVRHGYKCTHPDDYLSTLLKAMSHAEEITEADRVEMGKFILAEFTWEKIAKKWQALFEKDSNHKK